MTGCAPFVRRVAMVSEHASPLAAVGGHDAGGQNIHVAALATRIAELGVEVWVHTRRDDPGLPATVELAPGVMVRHVDAGPPEPVAKDDLPAHMPEFTRTLRRDWSWLRPDVVHAHFWMSGQAALAAAVPLAVPVAHTFHALGMVKRRYQGAADTSPPQRLAVEGAIARRAARIVATCRDEAHELAAMGAPPERVRIVPCGVDLTTFGTSGPCEPRGRPRRLVTVGRLVARKGLDDAIAALAWLPDTELVVAGGPEAAELDRDPEVARLCAVAAAYGVADRVVFRGQVAHDAMPALLRSADAVVCTPWYEPFGIVPLEAMACGVPVVASAVGGMLDTVVDGRTGRLVPPRDRDGLAAALAEVLGDDAGRAAMGARGAARARRYAWPDVAAATLDVYADAAADEPVREAVAG